MNQNRGQWFENPFLTYIQLNEAPNETRYKKVGAETGAKHTRNCHSKLG